MDDSGVSKVLAHLIRYSFRTARAFFRPRSGGSAVTVAIDGAPSGGPEPPPTNRSSRVRMALKDAHITYDVSHMSR